MRRGNYNYSFSLGWSFLVLKKMINGKFAGRLKSLLEETETTQKELANSIGAAQSVVTAYLQKKSMPSVEKLEKLSDFFEVSIDYLLGRDHEYEAKGRIIVCPPPESIAESEEELRAIQKRIKDIMLYNIARMEYKKRKREREREKAIKRGTSTKAKKR